MPEMRKATCLFCSLQCGFTVEVEQGIPMRIGFDPDAPTNRGSLCARGHYNLEILLHPKRLLAASIKRRRVPWATAIAKAAGGVSDIKGGSGGGAFGVILGTELSNEDLEAATAFARDVLGTSNVAVAYDGCDYPLLLGGGSGTAVSEDLDGADCFVLIGDVFLGHPCVSRRIIEARHASRSHRIYTLNPLRTNTDWFADVHIAARPGSEPLVLAALLNAVNAAGVPKVDPEKACEAGGLSPAGIDAIANDLSKWKKNTVVLASPRLGDTVSGYLTGLFGAKLAESVKGKYAPLLRGGNAIGAHARVGSTRTVPEILSDIRDKKIKGLFVFGPDVLQLYPGAISRGDLEGLDLTIASGIFDNEVTKCSTIALPQAAWTEMAGTYTSSLAGDRAVEAVVPPQGDGHSLRETLGQLSRELGVKPRAAEVGRAEGAAPDIDVARALAEISERQRGGTQFIENISPLHRWDGGITGKMSFTESMKPYCEVWVGVDDAGKLGIEHGCQVALATERGETRMIAVVTDRVGGGVVAVPTYVPDMRGLLTWAPNTTTRWYDVSSAGASVKPAS